MDSGWDVFVAIIGFLLVYLLYLRLSQRRDKKPKDFAGLLAGLITLSTSLALIPALIGLSLQTTNG